MKVARLMEPYRVVFEDVSIPHFAEDQVLLKVLAFGICASDMQIYHGLHKYAATPVIMGHEVCARVEAVGSKVTGVKLGDLVTVEPQLYCGECTPCKMGRFNVCRHLKVMGVHVDGFNCEYFAIHPRYLHSLPAGMDIRLGALVEPMAVGVGSAKRSARLKNGNVVVVGAGTIGNLTAQAAKNLGAKAVLVTDIVEDKLDYALECGIDFVANTAKLSLKEAIEKYFGEKGADIIIDACAVPAVFNEILGAARPSSDIVVTGNYKAPVTIELPVMQRQEISILGHMMYVREDFRDAIDLLSSGRINTKKIITQVYPFDEYIQALDFCDKYPKLVTKMIITM